MTNFVTGRLSLLVLGLGFLLSIHGAAAQTYGLDNRAAIGTFLNNQLPASQVGGSGDWVAAVAFPNLTFEDAVALLPEPGSDRLYVCGRQGLIWFFQNNPSVSTKTVFLDIRARTQGWESCGLLGMAFHPEFRVPGSPNRGFFYVYYSHSPSPTPGPNSPGLDMPTFLRLSRFTVPDGAAVADPNSELVLVQQYDRHIWHNGGSVFFGNDGFLYFVNGDEGGMSDPHNSTQTLSGGLFSGVFRIDVDRNPARSHPIRRQPRSGGDGSPPSFTDHYFIPNDNPFLDPNGGVLEEYWALGFRSPHRTTYDPVTGQIWVGDVGQDVWEEVSLVLKGRNYQWPYQEGFHPGVKPKPFPLIGIDQPPVYDYQHLDGNNCVIGGYVYRGVQFAAALGGKYIFGDNGSGRIWAMTYDGSNPPSLTELCHLPAATTWTGLSGFGLDRNGELYMCKMGSSEYIYKLARNGLPPTPPPALLSQTGAFADLQTLQPAPGLIPYDINVSFWSDGAEKKRWIAVPNNGAPYSVDEKVAFAATGEWGFPAGTVLVKHFELPVDDANPSITRRLETRFIVRDVNGGVYGITYKWRSDNRDADLLSSSLSETIPIRTASGGTRSQTWYYPSRQDCVTCHNPNAKHVLGLNTRQLNANFTYPATGRSDNQLRTWNHLGLFNPPLDEGAIPGYARLSPLTNTTASLGQRVRSYLDANCAQCHRPNGVFALFDARYDTPLASQGIINGQLAEAIQIPGTKVVVPGSLSQSMMYLRLNSAEPARQMPPLARNVIDAEAVSVLAEWIQSLENGGGLPSPWLQQDVGAVGLAGSASYADGTFIISGSGTDIWETSDGFHFVYQRWTGDGEITARVTGVENTDGWAKAGVMFRESLAPGARHAMMLLSAANGAGFQRRLTPSSVSTWTAGARVSAPYWVRLVRAGNRFSAFGSMDGANWLPVAADTNFMAAEAYVGLAVTAHNNSALNTATFSSVRIVQPPRFTVVSVENGGRLQLGIEGEPGRVFAIEASPNLSQWTQVATRTNLGGSVSYLDQVTTNRPQRFYRAILQN